LTQLDKITVFLIVDLDGTPWVTTAADLAAISGGYLRVCTNHGKWNLRHDLLVLGNGFFVIKFVTGSLEDLDGVVLDIGKNLDRD
jgi:hypothetical protein